MRTERRNDWKTHWKKYKNLYKGNRIERRNKWRIKWENRYKAS